LNFVAILTARGYHRRRSPQLRCHGVGVYEPAALREFSRERPSAARRADWLEMEHRRIELEPLLRLWASGHV